VTGPEHYQEAERLLAEVTSTESDGFIGDGIELVNTIAAAQVHATLALAASNALSCDDGVIVYNAWWSVAGGKT
jgi:hypothetical protein